MSSNSVTVRLEEPVAANSETRLSRVETPMRTALTTSSFDTSQPAGQRLRRSFPGMTPACCLLGEAGTRRFPEPALLERLRLALLGICGACLLGLQGR